MTSTSHDTPPKAPTAAPLSPRKGGEDARTALAVILTHSSPLYLVTRKRQWHWQGADPITGEAVLTVDLVQLRASGAVAYLTPLIARGYRPATTRDPIERHAIQFTNSHAYLVGQGDLLTGTLEALETAAQWVWTDRRPDTPPPPVIVI